MTLDKSNHRTHPNATRRAHATVQNVSLPGPHHLLSALQASVAWSDSDPIVAVRTLQTRKAATTDWPDWVAPELLNALWQARGNEFKPWRHQITAAQLAYSGKDTICATGTASGKSLAYQLPILTTLLADENATTLYLAPTKALAADQLRAVNALDLPTIRPGSYDGDTPMAEREWARKYCRWLFTNPDMLHHSILPGHKRWGSFLRKLRYVVVDECHSYRGVFGSHVAAVLRRLERLCENYGNGGQLNFFLASATLAEPETFAARLTGRQTSAVTTDDSPRGQIVFALAEPPFLKEIRGENDAPVRRSATSLAADMLADAVSYGAQSLVFVRSRRAAETVALTAAHKLEPVAPKLVNKIAAYRAGYLYEDRRALEQQLRTGQLLGVASTSALELGVNIAGLDAVFIAGFPGTLASLWQQAGRAGRDGQGATVVFIARDDPLDTYLVHHPGAIFDGPLETAVLDVTNPYVLGPHLCCAAAEAPITETDLKRFGGEPARAVLADLVTAGWLRKRPTGWYWTARQRPEIALRGTGGEPVAVVEAGTGRLLGTVDAAAADHTIHPGAIYLHQGQSFVVEELDLDDAAALVRPGNPDWTTHARQITDLRVRSVEQTRPLGKGNLHFGSVEVTSQVVSYLRRRWSTGEVLGETPLELPPRQLHTKAVWWTLGQLPAGLDEAAVAGAAHAAEHAAIGLLPLVASCDRWDIGGLSTAQHPDTGEMTVFVYDGHPGGAGFAERGFEAALDWLAATREAIAQCPCEQGCPSCVQSPKCGNGNQPLDKAGAVALLEVLVGETGS